MIEANWKAVIEQKLNFAVHLARQHGFTVTVEQVPLKPLAMGNHATRVSVREARRVEYREFDIDDACEKALVRLREAVWEDADEALYEVDLGFAEARIEMRKRHRDEMKCRPVVRFIDAQRDTGEWGGGGGGGSLIEMFVGSGGGGSTSEPKYVFYMAPNGDVTSTHT